MSDDLRLGLQIWPSNATWEELRAVALTAEELGFDSIFTWDHFAPVAGIDPYSANFEGWQVLAAWAAVTKRAQIGMLVTGNTYRHPAIVAKMAATLDHISAGRAIAGMGAAWFEFEHTRYGIAFPSVGQRIAQLEEALIVMRSLFTEPRTEFRGRYYQLTDAPAEPKPIQKHLPILVGGSGEQKTLRVVAKHADIWHCFAATAPEFARLLGVLEVHCEAVGRDPGSITPSTGGQVIIRDSARDLERRFDELVERHRVPRSAPSEFTGTVDHVATHIADRLRAGCRLFIASAATPFDEDSLGRLAKEAWPQAKERAQRAPP
jgi:F420-dependent oxidoreductase-like protein